QFGIQPTLLLAQIVNFVIILFLLKRFFYKPISRVLEDRKKKIEESLKNAQLIEEKLAQTEKKSVQILDEARNNAQNIIDEAKREAEKNTTAAAIEARNTLEQTVASAKAQIEAQRAAMQKDLEQETLALVVEVTKKVLSRTIKPKERQELTSKAATELTRKIQ
ncbi:F0F1 ATP synthase subunit B, partial [Candidatus Curtissbacteria bacterium]|nr:F0F1 ATP synthase subunit B [Candidatus Curtissbacteria bacterium]